MIYTVQFLNWNNEIISSNSYKYGETILIPNTPSKENDSQYSYSFVGWDSNISSICIGNATYKAQYSSILNVYTVKFVDWNNELISSKEYKYGDFITIPSNPSRVNDDYNSYEFIGWDKPISSTCVENVTYKAEYKTNKVLYTIKFINWNNEVISSGSYGYGDLVLIPNNPTKQDDLEYTYKFIGWDKEVNDECLGNATYKAQYTAIEKNYTITFLNWNGEIISTLTYKYGETINIPANPIRVSDSTYEYTFTGWNKVISNICTGNETYTAVFESKLINNDMNQNNNSNNKPSCGKKDTSIFVLFSSIISLTSMFIVFKKNK